MQFEQWESKLPRSLKDNKGEFKGSALSDEQLADFACSVIRAHYFVRITPVAFRATDNPAAIVEKHRAIALIGVRDGTKFYSEQGRVGVARTTEELGNWMQNLSYPHFVKILTLGHCITRAMVNAIGHSVSARYHRDELPRLRFLIDRDFIKQPRHDVFWHEVLRNQLYANSLTDPIPMLDTWEKTGHPFVELYTREDGETDYNKLFWNNCTFGFSHQHFEIRMADIVATILYRFLNKKGCAEAYKLVRTCFARDRSIFGISLNDVDLENYRYDRNNNPLYRKWLAENS
jgi:hypothetical protein